MRKLLAEFIGTATLVIIGVGVATLSFGFKLDGSSVAAGVVATALAFGLVLLALAYALGPISGCHVNPAVTLGFVLTRRMRAGEAVGYWVAQFAGGIVGAGVLWGIVSTARHYSRTTTGLGTDGYGTHSMLHISSGGAFLTEVVLTAVFVLIVLASSSRIASPSAAGAAIGLGLACVHLVGIPLTGTSVNPARALGPALIVGSGALSQVWVFILAPLVGAAVAAGIYLLLFGDADRHAPADDAAADPSASR